MYIYIYIYTMYISTLSRYRYDIFVTSIGMRLSKGEGAFEQPYVQSKIASFNGDMLINYGIWGTLFSDKRSGTASFGELSNLRLVSTSKKFSPQIEVNGLKYDAHGWSKEV